VVGACLIGVWLHEMPTELVTRAATFKSCEEEICANAGGAFPYIVCLICSATHAAYFVQAANHRELFVEKLTGHQLIETYPEFIWTLRCSTVFTRDRRCFLSWARRTQSTLHSVSPRFIL